MPRCECPDEAGTHSPGECQNTIGLKKYQRGDRVMLLCCNCHMNGDKEL